MIRRAALFLAVLPAVTSFFLAQTILYSRNAPQQHPEWVNGKALLCRGIMGSPNISFYRNALQNNQLHFGVWYGFNEFDFYRPFAFGSLTFRFKLPENAHLSALVNRTADGYAGVRLSRLDELPSMWFRADANGRFLEKAPLEKTKLGAGWHTAELKAGDAGLGLTIDGKSAGSFDEKGKTEQVVGFRAGAADAVVDDVVIRDAAGALVWKENFSNRRNLLRAWFFFFLLLLVIGAAPLQRAPQSFRPLFSFGAAMLLLTASAILYQGWDRLFWSKRYPFDGAVPFTRATLKAKSFEKFRGRAADLFAFLDPKRNVKPEMFALRKFLGYEKTWDPFSLPKEVSQLTNADGTLIGTDDSPQAIAKLRQTVIPSSATVIVFMGTSQTFGTGAYRIEDRYPVQVQRRLTARFGGRRAFVTLNLGRSGKQSADFVPVYTAMAAALRPDVAVYDFGNNDTSPDVLEKNLSKMAEVDHRLGVHSLFILEPNSFEATAPHLDDTHDSIQQVAAVSKSAALDLHSYMQSPEVRDTGFLWWDQMHFSSHGMDVAGRRIADAIEPLIRKR